MNQVSIWVHAHLHLPQSFGARSGGGRLTQRGSEEDVLLLLVLVARQKLLLFGVKQPDDVSLPVDTTSAVMKGEIFDGWKTNKQTTNPLQNIVPVVAALHEQVDLPAGVTVHGVDLQTTTDLCPAACHTSLLWGSGP